MFWSTLVLPKNLLTPTTLAAYGAGLSRKGADSERSIILAWAFILGSSIDIQPISGKKQHAENQERKERQHNGNRIGSFNLTFVEFGEDVKWRGLRSSRQIT